MDNGHRRAAIEAAMQIAPEAGRVDHHVAGPVAAAAPREGNRGHISYRHADAFTAGLRPRVSTAGDDAVVVTGGWRMERNDAFSGRNRYPLLPMLGLAVVRNVGNAELKWRAAYGKGIRPPQTPARSASSGLMYVVPRASHPVTMRLTPGDQYNAGQ